MMKNLILTFILLTTILIFGCAPVQEKVPLDQKPAVVEPEIDSSDQKQTDEEPEEKEVVLENLEIDDEVKELLSKSNKNVQSFSYKYKGPETKDFFYDLFVKENKVKYILDPTYKVINADDDAYDTIYLDVESETAKGYCDDRKCKVNGKKADLVYDDVYIWTPFDWLDDIESPEKIGEELIGKRSTWKLSTNKFMIWIDTFFGVPLQVEFAGELYNFDKMIFNQVNEEEVIPKS